MSKTETGKQRYFEIAAKSLIEALKKRNMEGFYVKTKEEALEKVVSIIDKGSTISWGGSETLNQIGFPEAVSCGDYIVYDRSKAKSQEESQEIARKAFFCDYYLLSSSAITNDGELINIDGFGNRLAALIFGPKHVIIVIGMQKLVADRKCAISRVRNTSAIMNALRLNRDTPCAGSGICHDCTTDECLCSHIVVTRMSKEKNRIKIILVGEELGF